MKSKVLHFIFPYKGFVRAWREEPLVLVLSCAFLGLVVVHPMLIIATLDALWFSSMLFDQDEPYES